MLALIAEYLDCCFDLLRVGSSLWFDEILSEQQINGKAPNLLLLSLIPAAQLNSINK